MKLFITGSNGQLGWELCRRENQYDKDSLACDLPRLDLTNKKNIADTVAAVQPDLIINTAAYTAVDQAEREPDKAFAVNRDGAANIASVCKKMGIPLIHISTDYVFDGKKESPYNETDPISPLGVYGQSKAEGEEEIRKILKENIILRTSWLYSTHGNNFVKTMLRLGKEKDRISVINDQFGCPTYAGDLADAILNIAGMIIHNKSAAWGTYHFSNTGKTTWFCFSEQIFRIASTWSKLALKELLPITTAEFPTLAKRPKNSELNCDKVVRTFGVRLTPWEDSLRAMMESLCEKL